MARSRTLLVAGAGIGGLAAAIALARTGFRPVVLERTKKLEEIGAGIQLSPNACRALRQIGVLAAVEERAVRARSIIVASGESGQILARAPLADVSDRFGGPWLLTLRADLQRALYGAAEDLVDINFEFGAELTDFAAHARGVTALTKRAGKSEEHIGLALIGADGLKSRVRAALHGAAPPLYRNMVAWRALVPAKSLPARFAEPVVHLWLGADAHLVHYPVARGEAINVVAVFRDDWRSDDWNAPTERVKLPDACDEWAESPQRVIAAAPEFRRWALADRDPLPRWGTGRVTLLGDAAHPMLPFVAQGAAAALEDAAVIANRLDRAAEIEPALRAYEAERVSRTARMQKAARFAGRVYHARGPLRWARDFRLRWNGDRLLDRSGWIYRYDPRP